MKNGEERPQLPWRPFPDRPLGMFVEIVLQHLKDTAQPESMESLYRNPIPKDIEFNIIKKDIVLDGRKRPEGDNAPCPMCTPNRFLTGALIHVPKLQCVAMIGRCCADKKALADAEREYRQRTLRDYEETYLLQCLPFVRARMTVLQSLGSAATEGLRLYRKFRRDMPRIHSQLRHAKREYSGHLRLSEVIRGGEDKQEEIQYVGPAGFRGRGRLEIETREHDFGIMSGAVAVISDYNPVKELEMLIRQLESVDALPTEDAALDFIVAIDERQRHAGVAIMEGVDVGVIKFSNRLRDFLQFFTRENAAVLNAFGTSPHNNQSFSVEFELIHNRPCLRFKQRGKPCKLEIGPQFGVLDFSWPTPPKPN
jgi:hypothetical protein